MKNLVQNILIGIITAGLFSAFIYFEECDLTNKFLNTFFGISAIVLLLYIPKKAVLSAGFFIGLLWFYWIGYSFKYQGVGYMTPIITFGFGIIYMLFFGFLALTNKIYLRAIFLFALSYFQPFDFNWMQIELLFVESYIGVYKYQLILVLVALTLPYYLKGSYKYTPLLLLLLAINLSYPPQKNSPLSIKLVSTDIKQEYKWTREALVPTEKLIFSEIQKAIDEKYQIVVLPESVFPLYMNYHPSLMNRLLKLSKQITIIAGALLRENGHNYNVSYMFDKNRYVIAKKMLLVPFGEYIPLPKFAQNFINKTFFSGASDFVGAKKPTDFIIDNIKYRNAICYEATCQEIYDGDVKFVIAMSNNAWFAPSIEPTLQNLLLKYYARKNGVTIYHSVNGKGGGIIQ